MFLVFGKRFLKCLLGVDAALQNVYDPVKTSGPVNDRIVCRSVRRRSSNDIAPWRPRRTLRFLATTAMRRSTTLRDNEFISHFMSVNRAMPMPWRIKSKDHADKNKWSVAIKKNQIRFSTWHTRARVLRLMSVESVQSVTQNETQKMVRLENVHCPSGKV